MKKIINRKKIFLLYIFITLSLIVLYFMPLFNNLDSSKDKGFNDICNKYPNDNVYVLEYIYTTGPSWQVTKCSDPKFEGDCVAVETMFDPRFLKINSDFYFDYFGSLVVVGDIPSDYNYREETYSVIDANKIYISLPNEKKVFRVRDMSFNGLFKSILGVFLKYCRLSM